MTCDDHAPRDFTLVERARDGSTTDQTLRCPRCGLTLKR
mgnify:CR=1 FL=1